MHITRTRETIWAALFFCGVIQLCAQTAPPDEYMAVNPRPVSDAPFEVTPARVERGRYLSEGILFCFHCHSERDETQPGAPVIEATKGAGSVMVDDGTVFLAAPNLTPDEETGAGTWPDDALARAIREGVGHDGRALANPMRYLLYRHLSDEDIRSIVVYLRTLPPVRNPLPRRKLRERAGLLAIGRATPLTDPVPHPDLSDPVERGMYLVKAGDCQGCHTKWKPRQPGRFAGGNDTDSDNGPGEVFSLNISSGSTGVGTWPPELFAEVIRTGKAGTLDGAMPWQAFKHLTDEDLNAILAFLKTTIPVEHVVSNRETPTWCEVCEQNHGLGAENKIMPLQSFDPGYVIPWEIAGEYVADDGDGTYLIEKMDGRWMLSMSQGDFLMTGPIVPVSKAKFIAEGWSAYMTFELDGDGQVSAFNFLGLERQRFQKKK